MERMPVGADEAELLARFEMFRGLTSEQLADVLSAAVRRQVGAGTYFFRQGDPADLYYALLRGRVRVSQLTPEGQQVILHLLSPGAGFGMFAVLGQGNMPASAEALEQCHVLAWDGGTMQALMERHGRLGLNALQMLGQRLHDIQDRYRELATERVERRVARAILRLARQLGRRTPAGILIDLAVSRQDIAEMTGTTLYTVSRILSGWESAGLIESGRERLTIRSPHRLVSIAEDLPPPPASAAPTE